MSIEELLGEVARRKAAEQPLDMTAMELAAEQLKADVGHEALLGMIARLGPEDGKARRCPRCGKPVRVKVKGRKRTVRTLSGEVTVERNCHYCGLCEHGFYPRDEELGLPAEGELTREMERPTPATSSWCRQTVACCRCASAKPGSMGKRFPGIEACILDLERGRPVTQPGVAGLIAFRPGWPSILRGYCCSGLRGAPQLPAASTAL